MTSKIEVSNMGLNFVRFIGPTGPIGPIGPPGNKSGGAGSVGSIGSIGITGPQGIQGDIGFSDGAVTGAQGDTGSIGPPGKTGLIGIQGNVGGTGPRGYDGDIGITGPDSILPPGQIGPPGALGPIGPVGAQGSVGSVGSDMTVACGMIYRDSDGGNFEGGSSMTLIESRTDGGCGNVSAWTKSANIFVLAVSCSQIITEPHGFIVTVSGIYWFSYNLTMELIGDDTPTTIIFECRSNGLSIPGSRSRITVVKRTHLSHKFIYGALSGQQISVYAQNESGISTCLILDESCFIGKLMRQT